MSFSPTEIQARLQSLERIDVAAKQTERPRLLLDLVHNAYLFNILVSTCKIRIFDFLIEPHSVNELAQKLNVDTKLLDLLCKILTKIGLLLEDNGKYKNSDIANTFLVSNSPYSILTYIIFHADRMEELRSWKNIVRSLREGSVKRIEQWPMVDAIVTLEIALASGHVQKLLDLIRSIPEFRSARKILDIGCGSGLYAVFIAKMFPNAEVYALDLPYVIENITKKVVSVFRLEDKIKLVPADFNKDDIGRGYDIVLDFGAVSPRNVDVLCKIHSALNSGGLLVSKHVFLSDDMRGPLTALLACLWEYIELGETLTTTLREAIENLEKVGFNVEKVVDLDSEKGRRVIIARKR